MGGWLKVSWYPPFKKSNASLLSHMQLQERDMRKVQFASAAYTHRDWKEIAGRMKKHFGNPNLKANSPILAWHV